MDRLILLIKDIWQFLRKQKKDSNSKKLFGQLQKKIHPDMNRTVDSSRLSQLVNEAKEKIGDKVNWVEGRFEDVELPTKYDNIIIKKYKLIESVYKLRNSS